MKHKNLKSKTILFICLILLVGCTKPEPTCQNITINNTKIEYVYNTTIKEVFVDKPCNSTKENIFISNNNNTCDLSLINQIKILERTIDKWAIADINITINETNSTEVNST